MLRLCIGFVPAHELDCARRHGEVGGARLALPLGAYDVRLQIDSRFALSKLLPDRFERR